MLEWIGLDWTGLHTGVLSDSSHLISIVRHEWRDNWSQWAPTRPPNGQTEPRSLSRMTVCETWRWWDLWVVFKLIMIPECSYAGYFVFRSCAEIVVCVSCSWAQISCSRPPKGLEKRIPLIYPSNNPSVLLSGWPLDGFSSPKLIPLTRRRGERDTGERVKWRGIDIYSLHGRGIIRKGNAVCSRKGKSLPRSLLSLGFKLWMAIFLVVGTVW